MFAITTIVVDDMSTSEKIINVLVTLLPFGIILFDLFILTAAIYGIVAFIKNNKVKKAKPTKK